MSQPIITAAEINIMMCEAGRRFFASFQERMAGQYGPMSKEAAAMLMASAAGIGFRLGDGVVVSPVEIAFMLSTGMKPDGVLESLRKEAGK